jgi:thiamine biosynthesis lipoprotein
VTRNGLRATGAILVGLAIGAGGLAAAQRPGGRSDSGTLPSDGSPTKVQRQAYLMGTRATLAARVANRVEGLRTLERMLRGLEEVEAELSTWREDSWLSEINRQPIGTPRPAPDALCGLLAEVGTWRRATGGAFDPAVGSLVAAWGLREGGRFPSPAELARARGNAGFDHLEVQLSPCRVTRLRDVILDAGAYGKGAALDRVAEAEIEHGSASWMIDLGGQVAVGGRSGEPWPVGLAHPTQRGTVALDLRLRAGSLATSGGSVRDLEVEGRVIGHILDPRTGRPVSKDESVTVWHPRALVADVLSTALYAMGVDEGLAWAEARRIAACFLVSGSAGSLAVARATPAFRERFLDVRAGEPASAPRAR